MKDLSFFCHFPVKVGTYQNFVEIYYLSNKRGGWNKQGGWADFFSYVKKKRGQNANSLLLHENFRGGGTELHTCLG